MDVTRSINDHTELRNGTRVRTLVFRRRNAVTGEHGSGLVDVPIGSTGIIASCSHAGFRGREHGIRLDGGGYASGYNATQVEILELAPAGTKSTNGASHVI